MKLSMTLNYSGDPVQAAATAADYEKAGVDMIWVAELYSFDAVSILGYLAAKTERMELGVGHLPDLLAHPCAHRLHRRRPRRGVPGPLRARPRRVGPAGHRGLARRQVRQAPHPHPGAHRHLPHRLAARAPRVPGRGLHAPAAGRPGLRPRQAAEADQPAGPGGHPDLGRQPRPQERGDDRRARRRLAPRLLPPRQGARRVGSRPRRGCGQAQQRPRHAADRGGRHGGDHRRQGRGRRHPRLRPSR